MQSKGPRNADALPLTPTEGMREAPHIFWPQPDELEQFGDALLATATALHAVHEQRLPDDIEQRHTRVERRKRVLKDHLHVAAQPLQGGFRQRGDVDLLSRLRAEQHLTSRRLNGPQDTACRGGLPTAALTHQP